MHIKLFQKKSLKKVKLIKNYIKNQKEKKIILKISHI